MFRLSGLLSLAIAFFFGAVLFWTSQSVQDTERSIKGKKTILSQEKETIRVLSTEWDYLNRPQRLEELAVEGVGMGDDVPDDAVGIVSDVNQIPEPIVLVMPDIKPASLSNIQSAASGKADAVKDDLNNSYHDKEGFDDVLNRLDTLDDENQEGVR